MDKIVAKTKLVWKKPVIFSISKKQLAKHIKVAARSGGCRTNVR